ncbi:MAG: hypothetical protein EOO04_21745 [Chitinophagaceae bacterium]|nr:MAG: hypothetical protein EOO04_21745 [Chitinophagaceae bacterium]
MSFKNTILPDFVIADLYSGSLMPNIDKSHVENTRGGTSLREIPAAGEAVAQSKPGPPKPENEFYRYLGKNQKRVSVIARYKDDPYIPELHLEFLIKILSACKLNLGDVAILNDANGGITIDKLKKELDPRFVLLFAVEPVEIGLPLSFPLLRPQTFDGCNFLTIPAIASLQEDTDPGKNLKKQLWDCLRKMFGV